MRRSTVLVGLALSLFAPTLFAATRAVAQTVIVDIKTPPGAAGAPFQLNLPNFLPSVGNWAGFRMKLHGFDTTEVATASFQVTAINTTTNTTVAFGRGTLASGSDILFLTATVNAANSGIPDPISLQLAGTVFPVGTAQGQNSDVDVTAMLWNLRHIASPSPIALLPSALFDTSLNGLLTPATGPGGWFHNPGTAAIVVTPSVSALRGSLDLLLNVGVEHTIPEPSSLGIWGSGLILLGLGTRWRRVRGARRASS